MVQKNMSGARNARKQPSEPHELGAVPERRSDERSEADRSGGTAPNSSPASETPSADPEVPEKARRRNFTAKYKLRILRAADACGAGEISAMLRREGLYSSHLSKWRQQRAEGQLEGLTPKKRGRKTKRDPAADEIQKLLRENEKLKHQLEQAETIIEFQKKVSDILGISLKQPPESSGRSS